MNRLKFDFLARHKSCSKNLHLFTADSCTMSLLSAKEVVSMSNDMKQYSEIEHFSTCGAVTRAGIESV